MRHHRDNREPPRAGVVILMLDSKMEPAVAKDMLRGAPDPLWSEFRLGYAGLLAQLRCEVTSGSQT